MNRIYRTVFNRSLGQMQVASEQIGRLGRTAAYSAGLSVVALAGQAQADQTFTISDTASLASAIASINSGAVSGVATLNFTNNVTLNGNFDAIRPDIAVTSMQIAGNGHTLSGADSWQGFFIESGTVSISDLAISDMATRGGNSRGGGGGAGLGGAVFVGSDAQVTLSNVDLSDNLAAGGNAYASGGNGWDGGLLNGRFGSGGQQGTNATGSNPTGGSGGNGSFGVGGGLGGNPNYTTPAGNGGAGGNGGFGAGGGGGGSATSADGTLGYGGAGGTGGFGGGSGTAAGNLDEAGYASIIGFAGGGAGMGGGLFVQDGGSLIITGNSSVNGNSVSGGSAYYSFNHGAAYGAGLFLQGNGSLELSPGAGETQTYADAISDQTGSGGWGTNSGSWSLVKTGAGTLVLSGDNNYSGGTRLLGGVLQVSSNNNLGYFSGGLTFDDGTLQAGTALSLSRASTLLSGGGTLDSNGYNVSFTGAISGVGELTKTGLGTLTLGNSNSYQGGTVISAGSLVGSTNSFGSGAILNNASLQLSQSFTGTLNNAISGNGSVIKSGSGSVTLSGVNSYAGGTLINSGQLIGNASSFGTGAIINNAALVLDQTSDATLTNVMSGSGTLTKTGTGKLVLDGINTYTGTTTVNVGSLIVGGSAGSSASLSSDVNVASGALLGGHGSISGDVDLASGATLAPGNSIGTLTINGNATFDAGSTLEIEANPDGSSDRLIVNGNLDLGGATLNILAGAGTWSPATRYSIVTSSNPIVGTFGPVTSDLAFLTPTLDYSLGNEVQLLLMRNDISFASVGRTFNQRSVASALESAPLGTLAVAVAGMSAEQAQHTFDSLSGELHASSRGALFDDSRHVREAIAERLRAAQSGLSGDVLHRDADSGLTFWLKSYGGWSDKDGSDNVADFDRASRGTLIGFDLPLNPTWRLGMALGYGSSDLDVGARASSADVDSTSLAAYLGGQWDALSLRLGVAHSWNSIDSKRDVRLGALNETLKADYDADTTQVFGELGYALRFGELTLEPFAGLAHVRVESDGFSERGGAAALRVKQQDEHTSYASLGLNATTPLGDIAGLPVALNASLAWQHAFNEPGDSSEMTLATYGSFKVKGAPIAKDSALAQLGVNLKLAPSARLALGYSGQLGDGNSDHGVRLGLDIAF